MTRIFAITLCLALAACTEVIDANSWKRGEEQCAAHGGVKRVLVEHKSRGYAVIAACLDDTTVIKTYKE